MDATIHTGQAYIAEQLVHRTRLLERVRFPFMISTDLQKTSCAGAVYRWITNSASMNIIATGPVFGDVPGVGVPVIVLTEADFTLEVRLKHSIWPFSRDLASTTVMFLNMHAYKTATKLRTEGVFFIWGLVYFHTLCHWHDPSGECIGEAARMTRLVWGFAARRYKFQSK